MSKLFDKERLASKILQEAREQAAPPPAQSAEAEQEAKLHIRLLEETDANIHQLNSRLERFREDLNDLAQTMDARKAAVPPEPVLTPIAESSSAGWFGRIILFAIGIGVGALVMLRNVPPEPVEPPIEQSLFSAQANRAIAEVEQDWGSFSRPTKPAVASVAPDPVKPSVVTPPPVVPPPAEPERPSPAAVTETNQRVTAMETGLKDAKETQEQQAKVEATEEDRVVTVEPPLPKVEPKPSIVDRFVRPRPAPPKKADPEFKTVTPTNGQFTF